MSNLQTENVEIGTALLRPTCFMHDKRLAQVNISIIAISRTLLNAKGRKVTSQCITSINYLNSNYFIPKRY